MLLSKHKNHRNQKYLNWLRKKKCVVSGEKAQCAHHIRLGTNGGTGIKPSDYFCLPLLNEYHTTGPSALHIIGEETFLEKFNLDPKRLFLGFLKQFLEEEHDVFYMLKDRSPEKAIAEMIELLEMKKPKLEKPKKKKPSAKVQKDDFYEKVKELKKERDKELRKKLKKKASPVKTSLKGTEAYEKAKALKREKDKELRKKVKKAAKEVSKSQGLVSSEIYEKAKEFRKKKDKEIRDKLKEKHREKQKEYRKKLKAKLKG